MDCEKSNVILTADKDVVGDAAFQISVVDQRHSDGEVIKLVDIVNSRTWHVYNLQKLVTVTAGRQGALLVDAETTDTHTVEVVAVRQLKQHR